MISVNKPNIRPLLLLAILTITATLILEHSQLDVYISELFYAHGHWLLEKDAQPYAFIFYDFPKLLLILLFVYLIIVSIMIKANKKATNVMLTLR